MARLLPIRDCETVDRIEQSVLRIVISDGEESALIRAAQRRWCKVPLRDRMLVRGVIRQVVEARCNQRRQLVEQAMR